MIKKHPPYRYFSRNKTVAIAYLYSCFLTLASVLKMRIIPEQLDRNGQQNYPKRFSQHF